MSSATVETDGDDRARTASHGRRRRLTTFFLAVGLLLIGLSPYVSNLRFWPLTRDASVFVSASTAPTGVWVKRFLFTRHFAGFRPVAALSYKLNYILGGLDPFGYRLTDLALHALVAVLLYWACRVLAPRASRYAALAALGIFVFHPACQDVVAIMSCRSYTLAAAFGLGALIVFVKAYRARQRAVLGYVLSTVLLLLSIHANEVGYLLVPLLPVLCWSGLGTRRAGPVPALRACLIPFLAAGLALCLRLIYIGLGGYPPPDDRIERALSVVSAAWRGVWFPFPEHTVWGRLVLPATVICAVPVGLYYGWRAVVRPLSRWKSRGRRLPLVMVVWLLGYSLLYGVAGVWFPREAYVMAIPLAMLFGVTLAETVQWYRGRRLALGGHLFPQLVLAGWILMHSPVVRGQEPSLLAAQARRQPMLTAMYADLQQVREPAFVALVLPCEGAIWSKGQAVGVTKVERGQLPSSVDRATVLMRGLFHDRNIKLWDVVYFYDDPDTGLRGPRHQRIDGRDALLLPANSVVFVSPHPGWEKWEPCRAPIIWLDALPMPRRRHCYLYIYAGSKGTLVPLSVERSGPG